jgi:hypothetical protein
MENLTNDQREILNTKTQDFIDDLKEDKFDISNTSSVESEIKKIIEFGTESDLIEKLSGRLNAVGLNDEIIRRIIRYTDLQQVLKLDDFLKQRDETLGINLPHSQLTWDNICKNTGLEKEFIKYLCNIDIQKKRW